MNNKDIEKNLRASLSKHMPDVWDRVEEEISSDVVTEKELAIQSQTGGSFSGGESTGRSYKKLWISIISFIVAVGVLLSILIPTLTNGKIVFSDGDSFYLDINPSVCVKLNGQGKVKSVNTLNVDAEALLQDKDLSSYVGLEPEDVVEDIFQIAIDKGYIEQTGQENAILFTSFLKDEKSNEMFLKKMGEKFDKGVNERGIACDFITKAYDKTYEIFAELLNISVGKYMFIKEAEGMGVIFDKDYSNLSIKEINDRFNEAKGEGERGQKPGGEHRDGFHD